MQIFFSQTKRHTGNGFSLKKNCSFTFLKVLTHRTQTIPESINYQLAPVKWLLIHPFSSAQTFLIQKGQASFLGNHLDVIIPATVRILWLTRVNIVNELSFFNITFSKVQTKVSNFLHHTNNTYLYRKKNKLKIPTFLCSLYVCIFHCKYYFYI